MHHPAPLIRVLLASAAAFAGSIASARADNVSGGGTSALLGQKIRESLPRYDPKARSAAATKDLKFEAEPGVTHLTPLVIRGRRPPKFNEFDLLTEKARRALIQKRYGSEFQFWEEKRLQETAKLHDYANNLKLAGDHTESAAIQEEIYRLLVARNSDWVSQEIDMQFNRRYR